MRLPRKEAGPPHCHVTVTPKFNISPDRTLWMYELMSQAYGTCPQCLVRHHQAATTVFDAHLKTRLCSPRCVMRECM